MVRDDDRPPYPNRTEAGRALAHALSAYAGREDVVVLALPRGGVPVARPVADALMSPLEVFVVRKLGTPGRAELAMGAIASGGVRVLNADAIAWYGVTPAQIEAVTREEQQELERREALYRGGRPLMPLTARVVILIDDGLATGATMRAAVQSVRRLGPARVIVAVPVAAREACDAMREIADDVVCPRLPERFSAVGDWYEDFTQTSDDEVCALLVRG